MNNFQSFIIAKPSLALLTGGSSTVKTEDGINVPSYSLTL